MTLLQNNFDTGTAGSAITAGNSGGANGDAFAVTGAGRTYNADAMHGALSADFDLASGGSANYGAWAWTADDEFIGQAYIKLRANITASSVFITMRGGGASVVQIGFNSSNQIFVLDSLSANKYTSSAVTLNVWYRLDFAGKVATTSTGTLKFDYYLGDGLTPVATGLSITNANLGTVNVDGVRWGWSTSAASIRQMRMDSVRLRYAEGTTYMTPFGINTAPSVDAGANQSKAAATTANLHATATDDDGTITDYAWDFVFPTSGTPTWTGDDTADASFTTGAAPQLYIPRVTVTDDDSATASDTTEVRVPGSGTLRPVPMDITAGKVGTWVKGGGATTDGGALADESDATYIESPTATGTEAVIRVRIYPSITRSAGQIVIRAKQDSAGTLVNKVRLVEGTTQRQEWTLSSTTTAANTTLTLDAETVAAIVDWEDLYLEFSTRT